MKDQRILILGVTGMLGHVLFKESLKVDHLNVYGTARNSIKLQQYFTSEESSYIYSGIDALDLQSIEDLLNEVKPDIVINCIGIIKQLPEAEDSLLSITINALFPHQLQQLTKNINARVIHISTDCIFNGKKGNYIENDISNAEDLYGRTKYLGELHYPNSLTLRTSIIGHELDKHLSLIDWFLDQTDTVNGYTNAIFSGVTTLELSNIILQYIIPNKELQGLFHISSKPISKYDLLEIVTKIYCKNIQIKPYEDFMIDRSLDSTKFKQVSGYIVPSWDIMIKSMYDHFVKNEFYNKKYVNV